MRWVRIAAFVCIFIAAILIGVVIADSVPSYENGSLFSAIDRNGNPVMRVRANTAPSTYGGIGQIHATNDVIVELWTETPDAQHVRTHYIANCTKIPTP